MRRGAKVPEAVAFGKRVRELRDARGWTQEQLAEATGLTAVQISRIENGVHEPKLTTVIRLAQALGVKVVKLIDA